MIVGERALDSLVVKYLGGGPQNINRTEMEILLFALYNESKERGGIAARGDAEMTRRLVEQGRGLTPAAGNTTDVGKAARK